MFAPYDLALAWMIEEQDENAERNAIASETPEQELLDALWEELGDFA